MKTSDIKNFLAFLLFTLSSSLSAQNIGINTTGAIPKASAMLDVSSTAKGLLMPRMTNAQMNGIVSPDTSLIIFNTTVNCFMFYTGSAWKAMACACNNPPASPGSISGFGTVCTNAAGINYSVAPVSGALYYTWSIPSGASISSGQGTTSITVNFGSISGNIAVTDSNGCGQSAAQILQVSVDTTPAAPGTITGPSSPGISSSGNTYSIVPVSGATGYYWTISPSGATISSGQGTNSIQVSFGATPTSYTMCVYDSNACGKSANGPCFTFASISCGANQITLDQNVAANGGTSAFSISTTNPDELILIAANGYVGPFAGGSVTVDGNPAVLVANITDNGTSCVLQYTAPLAGVHNIVVNEPVGYSNPYYLNFAASFNGGGCPTVIVSNTADGSSNLSASITTNIANSYIYATALMNDGGTVDPVSFSGAGMATLDAYHWSNGMDAGQGGAPEAQANTYTITANCAYSSTMTMVLVGIEP